VDSLSDNVESAGSGGLNVELLEASFRILAPRADEFVGAFYENLFASYPETQRFFTNTDMAEQRKKLVSALVLVIENLRNPEALTGALSALGRKHQGYGIGPTYYPMVGDALLKTMSAFLADRWSFEIEHAWTEAYGVITQAMLNGYAAPHAP
jgi:nitric oxide dioxygenase